MFLLLDFFLSGEEEVEDLNTTKEDEQVQDNEVSEPPEFNDRPLPKAVNFVGEDVDALMISLFDKKRSKYICQQCKIICNIPMVCKYSMFKGTVDIYSRIAYLASEIHSGNTEKCPKISLKFVAVVWVINSRVYGNKWQLEPSMGYTRGLSVHLSNPVHMTDLVLPRVLFLCSSYLLHN